MSYPISESDYTRLMVVLSLNNFLRGICHGVIIPGLLLTITNLKISYNWFLLAIALFESFQVLGKLLIYIHSHLSFDRPAYFKFLLITFLSSSLYILSFILSNTHSLVTSLALQGLWRGCFERMESILIKEIDKPSHVFDEEFLEYSKNIGLICGPIIGYFVSTYFRFEDFGLNIPDLSFPGFIQLACSVLMIFIHLIIRIGIFKPSRLKPANESTFNRTESETLVNASLESRKKIEKSHLYIFTAMLITLNYSLNRAVKEVVLQILIIPGDTFASCQCPVSLNTSFVYLAFAVSAFFECIGVVIAYRPKEVPVKVVVYIPIILTIIGQVLIVSNDQISIERLAIGIIFQSLASPFGVICGRSLLSRYIGTNAPVYFSVVKMFLELIGSLIGPFWTVEAYMVKCGLCFSMISFLFGISLVLCACAHISKHFNKKIVDFNISFTDSRPSSIDDLTGKKKKMLLRPKKQKTLIKEIEMGNLKKKY